MAVLIEALSVIVKVSVLESKYPNGVAGYANECPNQTFCTDGRVTRVGFMCPEDVGTFLNRLIDRGLTPRDGEHWEDAVVIDQHPAAPTGPCDWIAIGRAEDGTLAAWSADPRDIPGELFVPSKWKFEGSLSQEPGYVPSDEDTERFTFDGIEGRCEVHIDRESGKKVYIGRAFQRGREKRRATPPKDTGLTLERATISWARAVNLQDPSQAAELLADDVEIYFQWSFDDFVGKEAYLKYWRDKFAEVAPGDPRTMAELASTETFPIPPAKRRGCVVLHHDEKPLATVLLAVTNNKITRISYCNIPGPDDCKRTGLYPGVIRIVADPSPFGSAIHRPANRPRCMPIPASILNFGRGKTTDSGEVN